LKTIASNGWMWVLPPAFFLLIIDFDSFILKPYETISAVLLTYLMGLIAIWMNQVRWNWKQYASIIITSTFTFLSYYFWWFIMIPVLFILAATSKFFLSNIQRILLIGVGIFLGVSIYLVPLLKTLYINGIENWQAHFFIPHDFFTFIPWGIEDGRALLYLVGMVGLWLFRKDRFIMANLQIVMIGFLYQLTNILMYLAGGNPLQSIKPMLFLGSAAIMIGASAAIIKGVSWLYSHYEKYTTPVFIVIMLILIPQVPMIQFIDNRGVQAKLEAAQKITSEVYLSQSLTESISNIGDYTWLSSGVPALNAYIPMKYYIAHSPHFSHQASIYSERMQNIQDVIESKYPSEFTQKMDALEINALLFYKEYSDEAYPLIFWKDNYPNGGEELILSLPKELVNQDDWKLRYQDSEWLVFTRKYD